MVHLAAPILPSVAREPIKCLFAIRQVIQTDGLTSSSSPITRAKGVQKVMPQSFHPLNTEEKRTLLARGEETITPQTTRASNFRVLKVHVH